jgi:hypothetical protein
LSVSNIATVACKDNIIILGGDDGIFKWSALSDVSHMWVVAVHLWSWVMWSWTAD